MQHHRMAQIKMSIKAVYMIREEFLNIEMTESISHS
jgi:hypothetical protein